MTYTNDEKRNILILCGHYGMEEASNSICVKNLAEEFIRKGHRVSVLAWGEKCDFNGKCINGVKVYFIAENFLYRLMLISKRNEGFVGKLLFTLFRILRFLAGILFYPNVDPANSRKYYHFSCMLIPKEHINLVISTYTPYDGISAGIKLKKKYGKRLDFVTYHLDLMESPENTGITRKVKLFLNRNAIDQELKCADKILLPFSARKVTIDKVKYVGFPLYIPELSYKTNNYVFSDNCINVVYIGSLSMLNRNPEFAFKLLKKIGEVDGKKIVIHIWGVIDSDIHNMINTFGVQYHGMVKNEETMDLLKKSDILLNISNDITYQMIPSKIFQYFASKRPVLNIVKHREDASLKYFERYNNSYCLLEDNKNISEYYNQVVDFVKSSSKKEYFDSSDFEEFTPSYICDRILC